VNELSCKPNFNLLLSRGVTNLTLTCYCHVV